MKQVEAIEATIIRAPRTRLPRPVALLRLVALIVGANLALAGCSTNPATGEPMVSLISSQDEQRIGRTAHPQIVKEYGRYADERVQAYVGAVGARLAQHSELPGLTWTFTVLDSPTVNAFALPGGYVYITRGLLALADNEAELASVLGHEIGHITARHAAQRQLAGFGANLLGIVGAIFPSASREALVASYSREQEYQADELGIRYMARAGYDVNAAATFLARLDRESRLEAQISGQPGRIDARNIMASHPRTLDRVERAARDAAAAGVQGHRRAQDELLAAIDGLVYGDGAAQGFVRGQQFLHPGLRIAFQAPPGFHLVNRTDSVIGRQADGAIMMFDAAGYSGGNMSDYLANVTHGAVREVQALEIGGFAAATGTASGRIDDRPVEVRLYAIAHGEATVMRFVFVAPKALNATLQPAFMASAMSFRRLPEAEAAALRPYRIRVVKVGPGDTIESLAARLPYVDFRPERFRALNGMAAGDRLVAGQKVKLIGE